MRVLDAEEPFSELPIHLSENYFGYNRMRSLDMDGTRKLPAWIYPVKRLVLSRNTDIWCRLPYPGHPRGCPNYGKKSECPPRAERIGEYLDLQKPLFLVHSEFNVLAQAARMHKRHPKWTDRQCRNLLYWQATSRRQLHDRAARAAKLLGTDLFTVTPEAMGVNVFATTRLAGLKLDPTRSVNICRHVALLGHSFSG